LKQKRKQDFWLALVCWVGELPVAFLKKRVDGRRKGEKNESKYPKFAFGALHQL